MQMSVTAIAKRSKRHRSTIYRELSRNKQHGHYLPSIAHGWVDLHGFTLATGLRQSNVTELKWRDVDLVRNHAYVHPEDSKTGRAIPVPLNQDAIAILERQKGRHPVFVFTYKRHPVARCNNHAWRKALIRAGIKDFRWHDLRHTWASWHVQNGTSLQELQQLGGWSSFEMVLRYAHLSSDHLRHAAERVQNKICGQPKIEMNYYQVV